MICVKLVLAPEAELDDATHTVQKFISSRCAHISSLSHDVLFYANPDLGKLASRPAWRQNALLNGGTMCELEVSGRELASAERVPVSFLKKRVLCMCRVVQFSTTSLRWCQRQRHARREHEVIKDEFQHATATTHCASTSTTTGNNSVPPVLRFTTNSFTRCVRSRHRGPHELK